MSIALPMRFDHLGLLWTVENVYTADECQIIIDAINHNSPSLASQNTGYRNQDRIVRDDPTAAQELYRRLKSHLPGQIGPFQLLGLNERLRLYRYRPGQQFQPHMDHWFRPAPDQISLLTVLVYFNNDFQGGQTRFMEQIDFTLNPKPGLAVIFQHKIRHEGCLVTKGIKYALRTDVLYQAPGTIAQVGEVVP